MLAICGQIHLTNRLHIAAQFQDITMRVDVQNRKKEEETFDEVKKVKQIKIKTGSGKKKNILVENKV